MSRLIGAIFCFIIALLSLIGIGMTIAYIVFNFSTLEWWHFGLALTAIIILPFIGGLCIFEGCEFIKIYQWEEK